MGGDEAALWRAIHANPRDGTPRLAMADYLDDNNRPIEAIAHRFVGDIQPDKKAGYLQALIAAHGGDHAKAARTLMDIHPVTPDSIAASGGWGRFYHKTARRADGTAVEARNNGKIQLWKTRPGEFRQPTKVGFKDHYDITHSNHHDWSTYDPQSDIPEAFPKPGRRR